MIEYSNIQQLLFPIILCGYGIGAIISILGIRTLGRNFTRISFIPSFIFSSVTSFIAFIFSIVLLFSGQSYHLEILKTLPSGPFFIHIDGLSAFFLGIISLLGFIVSIYSFGYCKQFLGKRNLGLLGFLYNVFLLSMILVVSAGDAIFFLIVWEIMSLTTYFLINYEHEEESSRRASIRYIVMTHVGTAFLIVTFLLLASSSHSYSFEAFRSSSLQLSSAVKTIIFLCSLIGFGMKAGIIPLHIWLPEAHPAAPSNISALMSGVMIKTGIYGMVRVFFDFLGSGPPWWGILILIIAASSAVLGVLYALMEHDLKRLLAFHSIENIGIILMGLGVALLFSSLGNNYFAALGLIAGLYHVLNHAIFKGLLFLGAGSVVHATHTRNIEDLGGLANKLPLTALFFLIGSVAISALPPLNGFISEWLTFQSLLLGFQLPGLVVKLAIPLTVALLALTGALAAACFVKAFGITFLGVARSSHAQHAEESSRSMIIAMAMLAAGCVVFGIFPGSIISILNPVASMLLKESILVPLTFSLDTISIPQSAGSGISPLVITSMLLCLLVVPIALGSILGGKLRKRVSMVWACGMENVNPRMQYTATGFSKPIRVIFSNIYRATHEIEIEEETSPYFKPQIRYELKTESIFEKYLYDPVINVMLFVSKLIRKIQTGHIQSYLAYIFITLILLLLFAR